MKVDLTDIDSWEGTGILGPGEHVVEVDDTDEGSSSGGHAQFELELRAVAGDEVGGTIRDWVVITPNTLGKVKQVLEAFGVANLDGEVSFDPAELKGKRCRIVVRNEPYDGKDRARVKAYQPTGAATNGNAAKSDTDDDSLPF